MKKKLYDKLNGRHIYLYSLKSGNLEVDICELGASINAVRIEGTDVLLGFKTVKDIFDSGIYAGATIGRVANRIAGGRFVLNGRPYFLNTNDGDNHLHGGNIGFDKKLFVIKKFSANSITFECESEDGEERYPGNLILTVTYTLKDKALLIEYEAISDKVTLWSPTNHAYFNLDGERSGDCRKNLLQINADYYTPADKGLIPSGERRGVKDTPFDFNTVKPIGRDFGSKELQATNGYDHNYILSGEHAARAESVKTGIKMDVYTDMPCMQLYTGGQLSGCKGKTINYNQWSGFCLEPQYCPNAINLQGFDKPILKNEENKKHYIKFVFDRIVTGT